MMALKRIKVLEFVGLAPGPFCGKILADFGANVIRIDKTYENQLDVLQHGKCTLAINLKHHKGQELIHRLVKDSDVLIEPFRPGVMENMNLGPDILCKKYPRLIYARLTGFGQSGRLSRRAGHDINYAAISGVLSMLKQYNGKPIVPINLLADFAGGGLICALGICLALLERHHSGCGQVVDAAMVEGAAYVASWLFISRSLPLWEKEAGKNVLDGGSYFYNTYKTKDGKYMSVAPLEPQFFEQFKERLGMSQLSQYSYEDIENDTFRTAVSEEFLQKNQSEWSKIFENIDACVFPVLEWEEVMQHDHNRDRKTFEIIDKVIVPKPAPHLSRTPGEVGTKKNLDEALKYLNLSNTELESLIDEGVILLPKLKGKL